MADETKGGGAPGLDDAKTEREAEAVARARESGAAGGGATVPPGATGDSPKPHGDKLEHAVEKAKEGPAGGKS